MPNEGKSGWRGKIGVVADSSLQRHLLQVLMQTHHYDVLVNTSPDRLEPSHHELKVDAWFIDVTGEDGWAEPLDDLLDASEVPVLFGEGEAPARTSELYPRWERRILAKLEQEVIPTLQEQVEDKPPVETSAIPTLSTPIKLDFKAREKVIELPDLPNKELASKAPQRVWVLGASLGGPSAVKAFLDCLPGDLPIAFVYAQHIDASFEEVLVNSVGRHSCLKVKNVVEGDPLRSGEVLVVPIEQEIVFDFDQTVQFTGETWPGPYNPSIDQVMLNVLAGFQDKCGAIIFSGMGQDGADAAEFYAERKLPLWTQCKESCASSTMPDAIVAKGLSAFSGTPQLLAQQLVETLVADIKKNPGLTA
ncbi:chemotaxis protein CheB [Zooshikella ganghwensis]|uniref:protein-glutamate methylesterase n=1 Tax=Zooshikella ganghwensis TaxID=202772 RepID=A0A4P9VUP6_9GAMM|nr:chemotaxis protein CheB [Zooshikella ganghwensis]RDH46062.1 chemotaxis protein CheB [Zooshikella ganghwensis]